LAHGVAQLTSQFEAILPVKLISLRDREPPQVLFVLSATR
jgi:hypothetical protein